MEILAGNLIFDHGGALPRTLTGAAPRPRFQDPHQAPAVAVDLDDDRQMEIIVGGRAWHHDGTLYYDTNLGPGEITVADLDADARPEVLLHNQYGVSVIEHDGTLTATEVQPGIPTGVVNAYRRPSVVHDLDGDLAPEIAMGLGHRYGVFSSDLSTDWLAFLEGAGGGATAFDFLGDGTAESVFGDQKRLFGFDRLGSVVFLGHRSGFMGTGYPVVADVDNDGSVEIVVFSNQILLGAGDVLRPAIAVMREAQDRMARIEPLDRKRRFR